MTMNTTPVNSPALAEALWLTDEQSTAGKLVRGGMLAVAGTILIAVAAKIQVPFYPVPLNMGTFAVLTLAMAYGPRLAMATILLYMAEGAAGLPVFAGTPEKGIGIAYMTGPTGGYLLGYVLATAVCAWGAVKGFDRHIVKAGAVMLAANVAIYVPGLLWLGALLGWDKPILEWGLYPFIPGDLTKLALAAASLGVIWRFIKKAD